MAPRPVLALAGVVTLLLGAVVVTQSGYLGVLLTGPPDPDDYGNATVTVTDQSGEELATVDVRVADTPQQRYTGLSETESLEDGQGMLFVHDESGEYGYVMRNMSFPLDIVFVAENGTITTIHHAPVEPNASGSELTRYRGEGRYVLEVNRGYTNATGIETGDVVELPADIE